MDARLQQICALGQAKPRTIDEIALALTMPERMAGMLVGRLRAAGALARDGANVTVAEAERVKAIAAGEVDSLPKRKNKKRRAKKAAHADPPPEPIAPDESSTVCFGKDEDGCLTITRRDGEGVPMFVQGAELARLVAYVRANFQEAV